MRSSGPGKQPCPTDLGAFDTEGNSPNASVTFHTLTPAQQVIAEETMDYLVSFVRDSSPNTHKLERSPEWPQYSKRKRLRMLLEGPREEHALGVSACRVESVSIEEKARYDFWIDRGDRMKN